MRKIMSICLMLMCQLALMGQTGLGSDPNYNPTNPEDPQTPEKKYTLSTEVSPKHSGSTNLSSTKKYTEGTKISLTANGNTGYKFVNWLQGDSVVSTSSSFSYTMPAKNVTLTAVFEYNPNSPADPDSLGLNYDLRIVASPKNGGTFNINNTKVQEAHTISLYAYPNTGYLFKGWQMGDSILSTVSPYTHTMGNKDTTITGLFEYNPSNPSNPGKNSWNEEFGEVVVDDFTAGSLYNAINQVTGGDNSSVTMITVSGRMSSNDFSIANNFSNCAMVDLKRTYGYTDVPDYAYDYNTALTSIILPASIENIGYRAFYQATNLADVTCYAITPPAVENYAFKGIDEGAVLHVLSAAIPLYAETEGWKDFTILPLTEEVQALEVNLPAGSEDGRYKNMTLELVNTESGQKQKYVISDRVTYTFYGLLKKSMFNVYVRNNMGVILGQIENILIEDKDISVSFESLLQTQDVTLRVQTPDGTDVTSQTQIRWFDSADNYLVQGNEILGQLSGTNVRYHITLPQELGMQYLMPADSTYTIQEEVNKLVCTLHPLEEVTISGRVKDVTTGSALSDAVVSISQKLNGLYSKSFTVRTDKNGEFTAKVFNDQSTITVSASDYLNHTLEFADFNDTTFVGEVFLKGITGVTIATSFTYRTSVEEGTVPDIQNWYSDYANVAYEIYNETQQRAITQFKVQYPSIILLEEVAEGDVLKLTASSRTNAFVPVKATTTIDAQNRAETIFDIVELGAIKANFTSTDNASVVGILYDGKGQLLKKYTYGNASLSISNLADGDYTLVSMTNSTLFNSILNLSQFAASGLKEGVDYVQNTVTVKSGGVATISNDLIPVLDESKLYYTGDNTLFSVNKTSIVAGNYLTLKGKIDFKNAYASQVSNVNMVVDLPESCSFVENSVMVGSSISGYTLDGSRLIIPLTGKYTDQVRFCVIPTAGGDYAPNAFAQFTLDNKEVLQPIGNAKFAVKDLTISVPSTVAKTTIPISGTALGNSTVEVYDNDVKIGETTSLANGVWSTTCELNDPYNLSTHSIYAKVTTKQGLELQTETHECMYDRNAIEVKTVTMSFYNGWLKKNIEVVFDLQNQTNDGESYMFYTTTDVTFVADLTNNDTTIVENVTIRVYTDKNNWYSLPASYDKKIDRWIAVRQFGSNELPVGVMVDFYANTEVIVDRDRLDNTISCLEYEFRNLSKEVIELDSALNIEVNNVGDELHESLDKLLENEDFDIEELSSLLHSIIEKDTLYNGLLSDSVDQQTDSLIYEYEQWIQDFDDYKKSLYADFYIYSDSIENKDFFGDFLYSKEYNGLSKNYSQEKMQVIEGESLISLGFQSIVMSDSSLVYYLYEDNKTIFIDTKTKMKYSIETSQLLDVNVRTLYGLRRMANFANCFESVTSILTGLPSAISGSDDIVVNAKNWLNIIQNAGNSLACFYDGAYAFVESKITSAFNERIFNIDNTISLCEQNLYAQYRSMDEIEKRILLNDVRNKEIDVIISNTDDQQLIQALTYEKKFNLSRIAELGKELRVKNGKVYNLKIEIEAFKNQKKAVEKAFLIAKKPLTKLPKRLTKSVKIKGLALNVGKCLGAFGCLVDAVGLYIDFTDAIDEVKEWIELVEAVQAKLPCGGDAEKAELLHAAIRNEINHVLGEYTRIILAEWGALQVDEAALFIVECPPAELVAWFISGIAKGYAEIRKAFTIPDYINQRGNYWLVYGDLKCKIDKCRRCGKNPCECKDECPKCGRKPCICEHLCSTCGNDPCICNHKCSTCGHNPCICEPRPRKEPIHDPSGYVYEGVSTNRLEGVMASCYYKETVEDMYGDLHENIVLWDAEQYAQENPLFTDENGMYRWDVPQGLWQVKFEKEGYETTYSEWLPVPPPQLEVNIAMTQNKQPEVKMARAYEDGIEVEFDKYMQLDGLTTENIFVTKNGETAAGTVTLLNEEQAYEDNPVTYASKVRFIPETSFLTTDEVTLTVSRKVKSYAGVPMEADYTQTFDIEKEVKGLVADSVVKVEYGGAKTIVVSALPYDAAIGKTLIVKSSSSMITTVDSDTLVLDENGQAAVTVTGELPGVSMLTFTLADVDVSSMSTVEVTSQEELITARPVASRVSGTAVYRNTEITLSCGTKDAVIYYTLDGSCPCDEATRLVYEGPIVVTDDNMVIKAMAVAEDMYESDVVEFNYSLKKTVLGMSLKEGWNWVSHNVETAIAGSELQQNATRIVGQTKELVNDPSYGLVGNLDNLSPVESYKVHVSKNTDYTLTGYEFNASTPICLYSGWNWLGYPVNQVMSVGEAFANATPMEGDYIVGQDGFALYSDGAWVGTLLTLSPGRGYMYQSKSDNEFAYNTAIVSKAKALYSRGVVNQTPWTADKHKYPNIMCIIAELYVNGHVADAGQYSVGAFCGTECRGVGKYVNGKLMMTVYGNGNEKITFLAVDNETEEVYNIVEEVKFTETLLGSMERSYALNVSDATGIQYAKTGWNVQVDGERVYLELNGKPFDHVSLTDVSGNKVLVVDNVPENMAVDMGALPDGTYIVTATQGDSMYYKKILKAGR